MPERTPAPTLLYLSSRRWSTLLATATAVAVLAALFGSTKVGLPTAGGGAPTVSFSRLFAVAAGVVPALTLVSRMSDLEAAHGRSFARCRTIVLTAALALSGALVVLGTFVGGGGLDGALGTSRAVLGWFGLALVSGRLLGWNQSWALPWTVTAAVLYWGFDSNQARYRWWEFTAQPADHVPSAALVLVLLLAGMIAYSLTPWHLRALRSVAHRKPPEASQTPPARPPDGQQAHNTGHDLQSPRQA